MYNYNFINPIITKADDFIYYVKDNKKLYIFLMVEKNIGEILDYTNNDPSFYCALRNNNDSYFTSYKGEQYILLYVSGSHLINYNDLYNRIIIEDKSINWIELWRNKVDSINELTNDKTDICIRESLDYYIGLSEVAIELLIYNNDRITSFNKCLCRKRINNKIFRFPNNAIIDFKERDIAEFIKYLFFDCKESQDKILSIIDDTIKRGYNIVLIYSRLLFPTYYFDLVEIFLKDDNDVSNEIQNIINLSSKYEELLIAINNRYLNDKISISFLQIKKS